MNTSLYDILDIPTNATLEEIKDAYRKLAKKNHPDKNGNTEKMAEINNAYMILSNKEKKDNYDKTGSTGEIPTFAKKFANLVDSLLMQIISNQQFDLTKHDIAELMKESIVDGINSYVAQRKENIAYYKKLFAIRKRITSKNDTTLFNVIDLRITDSEKQIEKNDEEIEFAKLSLKVIADYGYQVDIEKIVIELKKVEETK